MIERGSQTPAADVDRVAAALKPDEAINIQYTSGTTGFPKAATLSHRNLLLNVFYIGACQSYSAADRICIPVPFYHCFGCVLGTLCAVVYGAAMVVPGGIVRPHGHARRRSSRSVPRRSMACRRCSSPSCMTRRERAATSPRSAPASWPAAPARSKSCGTSSSEMGCREVTIGYGQTEASPIITQTRFDDPLELRVETVGRPLPGLEVKVVDPATGETLRDNTAGRAVCSRARA